MPRHALDRSLEQLRAELASSATLSPAERERIETLMRQVVASADGESDADDEPHSLAEMLQEATQHLEESHPKLTHAIGAVAEALSRLGI